MQSYKKWATAGVALSIVGILAGCGTSGGASSGSTPASNDTNTVSNATNNTSTVVPSTNSTAITNNTNFTSPSPSNSTTGASGNNSVAFSQNGTGKSNSTSDTTGTGRSAPSQIAGNVLNLSAKLSNRTSLPSSRLGHQPFPVTELRSLYGTIQASTSKKTTTSLRITLTNHGRNQLIYVDNSKSLKWLMGWQLSGKYLLLNIGEPSPRQVTSDFGGEAVVVNLKTKQVALKQSIGMESKQEGFITPTAYVSMWTFLPGLATPL